LAHAHVSRSRFAIARRFIVFDDQVHRHSFLALKRLYDRRLSRLCVDRVAA
jgi:hypothetical protein